MLTNAFDLETFVLPNWVRSTEPSTLGAEAIPMSHQPWGPSASCFPVPHLNLFPGCWGCTCIFFLPSCLGVRQFSFSLGLPFGCISIENKFGPCNNGD